MLTQRTRRQLHRERRTNKNRCKFGGLCTTSVSCIDGRLSTSCVLNNLFLAGSQNLKDLHAKVPRSPKNFLGSPWDSIPRVPNFSWDSLGTILGLAWDFPFDVAELTGPSFWDFIHNDHQKSEEPHAEGPPPARTCRSVYGRVRP